jgi:hypothetical protein
VCGSIACFGDVAAPEEPLHRPMHRRWCTDLPCVRVPRHKALCGRDTATARRRDCARAESRGGRAWRELREMRVPSAASGTAGHRRLPASGACRPCAPCGSLRPARRRPIPAGRASRRPCPTNGRGCPARRTPPAARVCPAARLRYGSP